VGALAIGLFVSSLVHAGQADSRAFSEAEASRKALESSEKKRRSRPQWDRVIRKYRELVHEFPRSGYADNALLEIGNLSHSVAKQWGLDRYDLDAVRAYHLIVSEYPTSRHAEAALFSAFEIERSANRTRGTEAARLFLRYYPTSDRAKHVENYLEVDATRQTQAGASKSPTAASPAAEVQNLRFWSGETSTRVVLDLSAQVEVKYDRLRSPERLYVDLIGTRVSDELHDRAFPVGDGLLEQIRVAKNRPGIVRVVLDYKTHRDHSIFFLANPARLVIDVHGDEKTAAQRRAAAAAAVHPEARPSSSRASTPPRNQPAAKTPAENRPTRSEPNETASDSRRADATSPPPAPESPAANSGGSYSIARQLGLGARRIVIDPGHGGHDPGSIGRGGLREKDVVLDVALRLEKLIRSQLGAEVILTRRSDRFIPLEERTAIANSKDADLFLSIHANSAKNRDARGTETYYLNFTNDPHAEEVAARENSISRGTLKDLQDLVKAITLNSKIDESRDFASSIQQAMVREIKPHYAQLRDRGVRTAPFYVLIGANMPSILAELAFISNPTEEGHLKTPNHRQLVAQSLLRGVSTYLAGLNRNQAQQLTARRTASTVVAGESGR
jgi:N-acetylmuramoyl-L-alanine amidase